MSVAPATEDLSANHSTAPVGKLDETGSFQRLKKTWPTTTSFELGVRAEQLKPTADTGVSSNDLVARVFPTPGLFGSLLAGHAVLFRGEVFFPLLFCFPNLVHGSGLPSCMGSHHISSGLFPDGGIRSRRAWLIAPPGLPRRVVPHVLASILPAGVAPR